MHIKTHYVITCLAYTLFGIGAAVMQLGVKAGLSLEAAMVIYCFCFVFYVVVMFTSAEKVKRKLFLAEQEGEAAPAKP